MCMDSIWLEGNQLFAVWSYLYGLMSKKMGGGGERRIYTTLRCHMLCVQGS